MTVFFFFAKTDLHEYADIQSFFLTCTFQGAKKITSFSFSMLQRYKVVRSSEQTAWEGTPQDVGQTNTNTVTDYLCWLCVFFCHESHMSTQGVCDSAPVNDRKVHALHSACPCWYGRWMGFLGREGAASFGNEGHRWQLVVHRGLPRALALSTYCVLLTGSWCHHGPLALTARHHVTVGLMVKQCKVRTVNNNKNPALKIGMFSIIRFSLF